MNTKNDVLQTDPQYYTAKNTMEKWFRHDNR
jgi:hypothetical protein